ncbi:Gp15 family bacteriophage protein [Oscillibacter sp.]|uniref:Gp15 family bacteriophage protein n=1 Tax=Oscillibacter sp. TaxID=1945593 RepID=UPI0028A1507C|nr:Gp15 family bacteriophage protein [Oscillibacter sp.]
MDTSWRELLPTSLDVCGVFYEIRSDYRAAIDICVALSDADLSSQDKAFTALHILYPSFIGHVVERESGEEAVFMPTEHYDEAIKQCYWFINGGDTQSDGPQIKLIDWEQDFKHIVAPINRVTGTEVRAVEYMHWWTFIAAYQEIGDCTFAQIVRVRDRKAKGKPLDKSDAEWYRKNRHLVDFKTQYTQNDDAVLSAWTGRKG